MDESTTAAAAKAAGAIAFDNVEVRLPTDMAAEIRQLAVDNGWPEEEAFSTVLSYGLNFLKVHRDEGHAEPGMFRNADIDQMMTRLVQLESQYAAMKFRAFMLKRDNDILNMRDQALVIDNNALRAAVEELAAQKERWKERGQGTMSAAGAEPANPAATEPRQPSPTGDAVTLRDLRLVELEHEGMNGQANILLTRARHFIRSRRGRQ